MQGILRGPAVLEERAHAEDGKSIRGNGTSSLHGLTVGGERLWAVANSGYGPLEFRIAVHGDELSGYWAGPFGQNGTLRGTKSK